jgi:hypothetical protein
VTEGLLLGETFLLTGKRIFANFEFKIQNANIEFLKEPAGSGQAGADA